MACNKPNGDCTVPGGCGCAPATSPSVPLPRCNDVVLPDGVYERATVVVQNGCIVGLSTGEPEVYTPDLCCDGGGGGGSDTPGPRGFPGPAGAAAAIEVLPLGAPVSPNWALSVSGTDSHRVLQFYPPQPQGNEVSVHGLTSPDTYGFSVDHGLVQSIPRVLRDLVFQTANGTITQQMVQFFNTIEGNANDGVNKIQINFDGLYTDLDGKITTLRLSHEGAVASNNSDFNDIFEWIVRARQFETQTRNAIEALRVAHNTLLEAVKTINGPAFGGVEVPDTILPVPTPAPGG